MELCSDRASFDPIQLRWPSCRSISTISVADTRAVCAVWNSRFDLIWREPRHSESRLANSLDALLFVRCCTLRGGVARLGREHPIRPIALSCSHSVWLRHNALPLQPIDSTRVHRRSSACATKSQIWSMPLATDGFRTMLNGHQQCDSSEWTIHRSLCAKESKTKLVQCIGYQDSKIRKDYDSTSAHREKNRRIKKKKNQQNTKKNQK